MHTFAKCSFATDISLFIFDILLWFLHEPNTIHIYTYTHKHMLTYTFTASSSHTFSYRISTTYLSYSISHLVYLLQLDISFSISCMCYRNRSECNTLFQSFFNFFTTFFFCSPIEILMKSTTYRAIFTSSTHINIFLF